MHFMHQEDKFADPVMEAELCDNNDLGLCTEAADFMNMAESASNAGHYCFDQSSISDSVGNLASGSHCLDARVGSAFFTPRNNLCQLMRS